MRAARLRSRPARKTTRIRARPRRLLTPSELSVGKTAATAAQRQLIRYSPAAIGNNPILSPSQLGYSGGFSGLFGGNKTETAPFKGEPTRDPLTQPPAGYQTPSPNFAYGTGPKESLNKEYNPAAGQVWRIVKLDLSPS